MTEEQEIKKELIAEWCYKHARLSWIEFVRQYQGEDSSGDLGEAIDRAYRVIELEQES